MTDTTNDEKPAATDTTNDEKPVSTDATNDEKPVSTDTVQPKSPLEFSWTFWYLKPDKRISWEKSLIKLIDIGFVEDFWATFNHLALPSRLATAKINSDYYFFKKGIRPMWEDPMNSNGGRWLLTCGNQENKLDDLWQETLLGMIGDCFSYDSDPQPLSRFITGCVVSVRVRGHKISLWLSESKNGTIVREIGRRWKTMMNLSSNTRIQFEIHNESGTGQQKPMYEE